VAAAERAGRLLVTVMTDALAEARRLDQLGIAHDSIELLPGKAKKVSVVGPDGNAITLGEPLTG
jgi:hypothetical protein